jgi:hypothetical protein
MCDLMRPFQQDLIFRCAYEFGDIPDNGIDWSSRTVGEGRQTLEGGNADAFRVAIVDEVLRFVNDVGMNLDLWQ